MSTMHRVTRLTICMALLAACAKADKTASDSAAGTVDSAAMAPAPKAFALADVAGKWNVVATPQSGKDTSVTKFVLTATGEPTGWTITFPGRAPNAVVVELSGDSIIATSGPYESVRRKGTQVTTNSSYHLQDGKLVGTTTAHYKTKSADSVLTLKTEGTRAP